MSKSTKSTKNTKSTKGDFLNELRTLQKRAETEEGRSSFAAEHYEAAYDAAYTFVLKGYQDKMRRAAERGSTRVYLYRWNFERDPKSPKYKFKGVRMLDIVTKGNLIKRLTDHFQKINSEFTVGWHKFKDDESKPTRYGIYVSWAPPVVESTEDSTSTSAETTGDEDEVEISV